MSLNILRKFSGHTALITGGASGIGFSFARLLAQHGWNCILAGRTAEKLSTARDSLQDEYGVSVTTEVADLANPEAAHDLFERFGGTEPEVTLLINNAGKGLFGPVTEQTTAEVAHMISLNITSLTHLSSLFGRVMADRGGGYILNVGSMAGRTPVPFFTCYGASKSYVRSFSIALRAELAGRGVKLCVVEPGYVKTAFDSNSKIESGKYLNFSRKNGMEPEDVARAGLKALFRGKAQVIPGLRNKLTAAVTTIIPEPLIAGGVYKTIRNMTS
jgi:hypothetical protein